MRSSDMVAWPSREATRCTTADSRVGWLRIVVTMKPVMAGSCRMAASASCRSRVQIGSTTPATASWPSAALAIWDMGHSSSQSVYHRGRLAHMASTTHGDRPATSATPRRPLRPHPQEGEHPLLMHLVADGHVVVAPGNVEGARVRHEGGELVRRSGDPVRGADRDEGRDGDAGHLLPRHDLPRAPDAGGESLEVLLALLGEAAEAARRRVRNGLHRGRLHGIRDREGQPDSVDELVAEPAEHRRTHPVLMLKGEIRRDARSHGIAHDVG